MTNGPREPSSLRTLLAFGRWLFDRTRGRAVYAWVFLVLGGFVEGISILLLIPMLQLAGPQYRSLGQGVYIPGLSRLIGQHTNIGLAPVLIIFVVLMLIQAMFMRFKSIYMIQVLAKFVNDVQIDLFSSIGFARWSRVAMMKTSDLNHVMTSDIDRLNSGAMNFLLVIQTVVLLTIYLVVAGLISIPMTLFAAAVGGIAFAIVRPIRNRASTYGRMLTQRGQAKYRIVAEFLTGLKTAKIFDAERRYISALSNHLDTIAGEQVAWSRTNSISTVVFQMANVIGLGAFVYAALVIFKLQLPYIITLIFVFMRIAPRFGALQTQSQDVLVALPAWKSVMALKETCEGGGHADTDQDEPAPRLEREIRFQGVTFNYAGPNVVSDVNLTIKAGQITALMGPSGGGKSTLADLLMGLLDPVSGTLEVDGQVLSRNNMTSWRRRVAYVPQDVFLLHDTIAANLALAEPSATEEMMWTALEDANAKGFVAALPEGLETVVGDRGARLSGGERQRIALARALLRRPDLLILDEATSALDGENQALIGRALKNLRKHTTILTIAHRAAMVAIADHVVILESGRVVEAGTYAELTQSASGRLKSLTAADGEETGLERLPD